jgi:penicillin-binding protein 1A
VADLRSFIIITIIGFIFTISIANTFVHEVDPFVKVESKGITKTAQRSYIMADNGKVIARLFLENREDVPLKDIPLNVQRAFVAIEDERFYKHDGIDYQGIARAVFVNLKSGHIIEGGSTITQQYVKNSIGKSDRTFDRKIREAILANRLEKKYSKDQILEAYLNTIYFGQGAYGIEAASEVYFGKKVYQLSLAEGALLAGITKSPSAYSPYASQEASFRRQRLVLKRMSELGFIPKWKATAAEYEKIRFAKIKSEYVFAPYFIEHVKQQLINEYGVERVFKGGLRVSTTLNIRAQQAAERIIKRQLNLKKDPEAALVSINPKNGHIIAMAGGKNFQTERYNLATQGKRQPGSSFKAFVLVTALKQGISPYDRFDSSSPQIIRLSNDPSVKPWTVNNSEGKGYGMMTLRDATRNSVNAVYANLIMKVKPENVVKTANDMGITSHLEPYPAMGIGGLTIGVSPLEMATAYSTLANGGSRVTPIAITKIYDSRNNVLKVVKPSLKRVLTQRVAYTAVDIMKGVISNGTATRAQIGRPAAGKTGTNEEYRDAWFVGFTPQLATAVWMGYPQGQISMYNVHGNRGFGGIIPATIWGKYNKQVLAGLPKLDFPKVAWVDSKKSKNYARTRLARKKSSRLRRSYASPNTASVAPYSTPRTSNGYDIYRRPLPYNGNSNDRRQPLNNQGYMRNSTGDAAYPRGRKGVE